MSDWELVEGPSSEWEEAPSEHEQTQEISPYSTQSLFARIPMDIGLGAGNLLRSSAALPYEAIQNLAERYKAHAQAMNPYQQKLLEAITKHNIPELKPEYLGFKGQPTPFDIGLQKLTEYGIPIGGGIYGAARAIKAGVPIISDIASGVADIAPLTQKIAAKPINKALSLASEDESMSKLGLDPALSKEVDRLAKSAPKSVRSLLENSLENAEKGSFKSIFDLSRDLGKVQRNLGRFIEKGENKVLAEGAGDLRGKLLASLKEKSAEAGRKDISDLVSQHQKRYRRYAGPVKKIRNTAIVYGLGKTFSPFIKPFIE